MSKKSRNKAFLAVLAVLAVIFFITRYVRNKSQNESPINRPLISVDSSAVKRVSIFTRQGEDSLSLTREGNSWKVYGKSLNQSFSADKMPIKNLLREIAQIKPNQLVSKSKGHWAEYGVSDSLAVSVAVSAGDKPFEFLIGKTDPASGSSYIRIKGDDETFATDRIAAESFSVSADTWRNKDFVNTDIIQINNIAFRYPDNRLFKLALKDSVWMLNEKAADSAAVANYLKHLIDYEGAVFDHRFKPLQEADYQIIISQKTGAKDIVLKTWKSKTSDSLFLNSSQNPDAYFVETGNQSELFKDFFVDESIFEKK